MNPQDIKPRQASTIVLLRDGASGIEVFMLRRVESAKFAAGMYVFPGGKLDDADHDEEWAGRCHGIDPDSVNRRMELERGGLAHLVAAVRECFEESGLLIAYEGPNHDAPLLELHEPERIATYAQLRSQLLAGNLNFAELCRQRDLRLAANGLAYLSRWITPPGPPRRFDTRFFVAAVPPKQTGSHDNIETTENLWVRPADALEMETRGELSLMFPTKTTLRYLLDFDDAASVIAHTAAQTAPPFYLPRRGMTRTGQRSFREGDSPYAELSKLDPGEKGDFSAEIVPGTVTRLADTVRRLTAPNPGIMTGPGTNTYLVGSADKLIVIDPGPPDEGHVQALLAAIEGAQVEAILVTHTHRDHSPAANMLATALLQRGARPPLLIGMNPPPQQNQDQDFHPNHVPLHGERLQLAGCTLRVHHTPGHASNHLCYLLEGESMMFTGDHIMQGSTVVISPPDGNMGAYLESMRILRSDIEAAQLKWLAPAHGFLIDKPTRAIDRLVAHRLGREAKVLRALRNVQSATLDELLPVVYDDVPADRSGPAARSLQAHLQKLVSERIASESDGRWSVV